MKGAVMASARVILLLPPKNGAASFSSGSISLATTPWNSFTSASFSSSESLRAIWNQ